MKICSWNLAWILCSYVVTSHASTFDPSTSYTCSWSVDFSSDDENDVWWSPQQQQQLQQREQELDVVSPQWMYVHHQQHHPHTNNNQELLPLDAAMISSSLIVYSDDDQEDGLTTFVPQIDQVDEREEEDDDEDDDDDDDDGHSSMLSNASLRRPAARLQFYTKRNNHWNEPASDVLLHLRGGAITPPASSSSASSQVFQKLVATTLVTLVFEGLIGHVLEFFKIVMQTATTADVSYWSVLQQITASKGLAGLWDGFVPWGMVQAVLKGAVFGWAHAVASNLLLPLADQNKLPLYLAMTLAGGIGGGFQGYVLSPTLLLKTRVMTNPVFREKMSLWRTTWLSFCIGFDVVRNEGFATLMKGANVFALKRVFDWATRYFFADLFESIFVSMKNGKPLTLGEKSSASMLGGVASTLLTLPLDVLVAKTQDAKKAGVKVSALQLFLDELKEKGLTGLQKAYMRGFEARLLHVCLTTVVIKTGTPVAYEFLFGKQK